MQEDQEEISKLLRLKRFEQPPPEYFEKFLQEFKDRQRSQLLREPAWRIAWDRLCAFFGEQMPVAASARARLDGRAGRRRASLPSTSSNRGPSKMSPRRPSRAPAQVASLNLNPQVQLPDLPTLAPYGSYGFLFHAALRHGCAACLV